MIHGEKFYPVPNGAARFILVANVATLNMARLDCMPGGALTSNDVLVEFNRAPHHAELDAYCKAKNIDPWRYLIVRHKSRTEYNVPESFSGYNWVYFISRLTRMGKSDFFKAYRFDTGGKAPTTGFAAWHCMRLSGLPVILFGFDPVGDQTSRHAEAHDWEHEARVYKREKAIIVK